MPIKMWALLTSDYPTLNLFLNIHGNFCIKFSKKQEVEVTVVSGVQLAISAVCFVSVTLDVDAW